MTASSESEVIAQELSAVSGRVAAVEARLAEIDKVIARLEGAALTTARALQEISRHWDAVYDAMRRAEEPEVSRLRDERDSSRPRKRKR
jgi:predicted nuclease with TOPRIM domain